MLTDSSNLDANYTTGIQLSTVDLNHLRTAGKWGRFISIAALVMVALGALFMFLTFTSVGAMGLSTLGAETGIFAIVGLIYAVIIGIYVYVLIKLYRFSTSAIRAADSGEQYAASEAFSALASVFKTVGIFLAIFLGFYAILIVFGLIGGAFAGLS